MLDTKPPVSALSLSGVQYVPGYRFGLRQPSLLARIDISSHWVISETLAKLLWEQVSAGLPERYRQVDPVFGNIPLPALMNTIVRLAGAMQDAVGLPVVDAGKAIRLREQQESEGANGTITWLLALPCFAPRAAELALRELLRLLHVLMAEENEGRLKADDLVRFEVALDEIAQFAPAGTNTNRLLRTALKRQFPIMSLPGGVWQIGWGFKARLFKSSMSDATSAIGTSWARNKTQTNQLLRMAGLPVPEQVLVRDLNMALQEAKRMGFPVVLKPADLDQGVGVEAGLSSEAQLSAAFTRVGEHGRSILLEKHFEGQDVRVNVVNGTFRDAIARYPAGVTGDGKSTVRELVEAVNEDPRRSTRRFSDMRPVSINDEASDLLVAQNLSESSVPELGRFVRLRRAANVSSGGRTRGVTHEFHSDNASLCELAAKLLRLDIAGIDLLIPDHSRSWRDVGAVICEVNAQPQVGLTYPQIYEHLLDQFLDGQGRIPACLVLTDDLASAQAVRQALLGSTVPSGLRVVMDSAFRTSQDVYFEGATLRAALIDPETTSLVLISTGESFGQQGLPLDRFDALWVAEWLGGATQLRQRINLCLPHLAPGQIFLHENLSALIDGQWLPSSHELRFGDHDAIALLLAQRLAGLSGGPAVC